MTKRASSPQRSFGGVTRWVDTEHVSRRDTRTQHHAPRPRYAPCIEARQRPIVSIMLETFQARPLALAEERAQAIEC
jgi:hypothetical protein